MTSSRRLFYEDTIKSHSSGIRTLQKRLAILAFLRLAVFSGMGISGWLFIKSRTPLLLGLLILFLAGFIILVRLWFRLKDRKALLEKLLFVSGNELGILQDRGNQMPDGTEWLEPTGYLDDLDIFGAGSLFHLLNRTTTSHGRERLAGLLRKPLGAADIKGYQQAVRVLSEQPEKRQLMMARGLQTEEKEGNLHTLEEWLSTPSRLKQHRFLLIFRWILTVFNILAVLYYLSTDNYIPLAAGIAVAWIVTGYFTSYITKQHLLISKKQAVLGQYGEIMAVFNTFDAGDSSLLETVQASTREAYQAMRRLARLSAFFDQRLNTLVNILFNSLFLYDLQCMIALEKWKENNKIAFPGWIDAAGIIESLGSVAAFAFNNPAFCFPVVETDGNPRLGATGLAHPLIPAASRIKNDCMLGRGERLVLVTGSNMSGKTTFLRTIGVNMVLAQCGAPVCADSFGFTPMKILTSLRVSDSLQEQTSYFMAELKKLQRIVYSLQTAGPALVLIDEILRGTNSEDKTYGSEQFIRKLLNFPALSLFATHDLSLGALETELPGLITNYCFESVITQGELHFDYLLQRGIARNRNASFLMKKMEII